MKDADFVVTMLPNGGIVRAVYTGDDGVFAGLKPGATCIDSSTIDLATVKEMAQLAADQKGAGFLDTPVSGGIGGAEAGTLTFMVGGEDATFAAAAPVFEAMGKNIVHCGAIGTGQVCEHPSATIQPGTSQDLCGVAGGQNVQQPFLGREHDRNL